MGPALRSLCGGKFTLLESQAPDLATQLQQLALELRLQSRLRRAEGCRKALVLISQVAALVGLSAKGLELTPESEGLAMGMERHNNDAGEEEHAKPMKFAVRHWSSGSLTEFFSRAVPT